MRILHFHMFRNSPHVRSILHSAHRSWDNGHAKLLVVTTDMVRSHPWFCAVTAAIMTPLPEGAAGGGHGQASEAN